MVYLSMVVLASFGATSSTAQICSPKVLYGRQWIHSHEEDTNGAKVYRTSEFEFPLSRGRDKFEIKKDGRFIMQTVGRSDRLNETVARWKKIGKSTFEIKPDNPDVAPFKLEVVSCSEEKLVLKRQTN